MPDQKELETFASRGAAAQRAVDAITQAPPARRRRDERVHHPELLEPIVLPRMREPQVIISMEDYQNYERFLDVFVSVENAIARGRLEARIEAYEMVLRQVEMNDTLSPVRQPGLIDSLKRIIVSCREDLVRLEMEGEPPVKPPAPEPAPASAG